jgi:ribosomal protein L25 (general stress protein Ctc)
MATITQMKATARQGAGKGAARAERRAGRVPGVVYGDGKPPLNVSVDHDELKQRIYAGRFLTTIYELDVDGAKHRVIPRDFQLDAVKDLPVHVDFLRLGEGAQIRVRIPVHVMNADQAPGVKRRQHRHPYGRGRVLRRCHSGIDRRRYFGSGNQLFEAPERGRAACKGARGRQARSDARHHCATIGLRGRNESGCGSRCRCCRCCRRCRCCWRSRRGRGSRRGAWCPAGARRSRRGSKCREKVGN